MTRLHLVFMYVFLFLPHQSQNHQQQQQQQLQLCQHQKSQDGKKAVTKFNRLASTLIEYEVLYHRAW